MSGLDNLDPDNPDNLDHLDHSDLVLSMRRVLFSQLKVGETYYEYYTDSRDKFIGFDGYCAIFKNNIFFAYKKCEFYELVPFELNLMTTD